MKDKFLILAILFLYQVFSPSEMFGYSPAPKPGTYSVYLFLGDECVISQQYTVLLKSLYEEYANDEIAFVGLFPNPSSNAKKIAVFKEKYQLPFELEHDAMQQQMDKFGVRVTPEVVVFQHGANRVVYQGRIDNMFYKVGKRRTITTTSELEDVLKNIKNKNPILPEKTVAVGCFITPLNTDLKNMPMCKPSVEQQ